MDHEIDREALYAIERSDRFKVLRRLEVPEGPTGVGGAPIGVAVVLDTETTGVTDGDVIIELAMRRVRYDADGVIVEVGRAHSWLEDPKRRVPPDVLRMTGIAEAELAGRAIDERTALSILRSADFVCAHNARFDAGMVVRRLPDAAGLAWTCSCLDVNWPAAGARDGNRSLGWLLHGMGLFHGAHRAVDDVDAVIALLGHRTPAGRTVLASMLEAARTPSWRFVALDAPFEVKDALRERGYRWDFVARTWWRTVADADREREQDWLMAHVYSTARGAIGPSIERVTWRERYAPTLIAL